MNYVEAEQKDTVTNVSSLTIEMSQENTKETKGNYYNERI